jgi:hypothetical protein
MIFPYMRWKVQDSPIFTPHSTRLFTSRSGSRYAAMRQVFRTHSEKFTQEKITTSHSISPRAFLYWRGCVSIYCLALLVLSFATKPALYFFFLTNLSWTGLTLYFVTATWVGYIHQKRRDEDVASKIGPWTRALVYYLYITQVTFQFLVVIIYWTVLSSKLLSSSDPLRWFISCNLHGTGLIFVVSILFSFKLLIDN